MNKWIDNFRYKQMRCVLKHSLKLTVNYTKLSVKLNGELLRLYMCNYVAHN